MGRSRTLDLLWRSGARVRWSLADGPSHGRHCRFHDDFFADLFDVAGAGRGQASTKAAMAALLDGIQSFDALRSARLCRRRRGFYDLAAGPNDAWWDGLERGDRIVCG